ncbi:MAG TPA: AAA family ATPase [Caldilineaceae bacterium]|nr:AAA family ATPase [Caldilineaceae bacterium]
MHHSNAEAQSSQSSTVVARTAIGNILDGNTPNWVDSSELGPYAEVYAEMVRAHESGGTEAARRIFAAYADQDPQIAALRAGDPQPPKTSWTIADLLDTVFPEPKWSIPGLLPAGLVILAGRPKLGKSWLALQMAIAVGTGGIVLGQRAKQGEVLYLALEDTPRRIQDRVRKQNAPKVKAVDFRFGWEPMTGQGIADLMTELNRLPRSLVVIDTISRALGRADQMDLASMNVTFGALQRLAVERDITLLLVDHHRKIGAGGAGDVIDDVMGASSKTGVADAAIGLYRGRGEKTATLKVAGRDVDDLELAIQWDSQLFCWQLVGDASGVRTASVQEDILIAVRELGGAATVAAIAHWLGKDRANIYHEVQELVGKRKLHRGDRRGKEVPYTLAGE